MQEYVVLVDDRKTPLGVLPKLAAHNANTPLHLGFSCYVFNKKGDFLLTQRALSKKVFPGVWTNSCCGHPAPDETTEDAVRRRLEYELGLEPTKLELVLPNFRYRAEMDGIVENEICPVYVATVHEEPKRNPKEVEAYHWVPWEKFVKEIEANPSGFSQWCVEQVKQLKKLLKERKGRKWVGQEG